MKNWKKGGFLSKLPERPLSYSGPPLSSPGMAVHPPNVPGFLLKGPKNAGNTLFAVN
jgi:hypothetical protein